MAKFIGGLLLLVSGASGAPSLRRLQEVKGCADYNVSACPTDAGCEVTDTSCVVSSEIKGCADYNVSACPTDTGCEVKNTSCVVSSEVKGCADYNVSACPTDLGCEVKDDACTTSGQDNGDEEGDEPSAACLEACPGVTDAKTEVDSADPGDTYDTMCKHKAAMTCFGETAACKDSGRRLKVFRKLQDEEMGVDATLAMLDCVCDACPSTRTMMKEMAKTATVSEEDDGDDHDHDHDHEEGNTTDSSGADAAMKTMCPMVESMECLTKESKCSVLKKSMGGAPETAVAMKDACEQSGYETSFPDVDNTGGTSSAVSAGAGMALVVSFLLQ